MVRKLMSGKQEGQATMKKLAIAAASIALIGANDEQASLAGMASGSQTVQPSVSLDNPAYSSPPEPWVSLPDASPSPAFCADRIREARDSAGLPPLRRRTADPDRPELIWAVDHRRDGCGVLVAKGDPQDIRPVPEAVGTPRMMPAGK
ncbi:hypothetical protein [Erythrobacter litoralis]|uniref:hypothetical protein n=1 Tax=Erythrobacter litoralis TaxID=39960 RepID=UPI000320DDDB|nr:hypothetical protein [Erythrobacter litoralis]